MESLIIFVHVIVAIGITGLVLIQHGKGADMGASFGSGASQTIFGSVGSGNALTKSTSWLATIFFATSLLLALYAKQQSSAAIEDESLIQNTGILNETPAAAEDLPVVESVTSDIPQAAEVAPEQAPVDAAPAAADEASADEAAADVAEQEENSEITEESQDVPVETPEQ